MSMKTMGFTFLVGVIVSGCGGANSSMIKSSAEASILGSEIDGTELTERFDLNGDGVPDLSLIHI